MGEFKYGGEGFMKKLTCGDPAETGYAFRNSQYSQAKGETSKPW